MALDRVPPDLPPPPGKDLNPVEGRYIFEEAGFLDPVSAVTTWKELLGQLSPWSPFRTTIGETWRILARAADPDLALTRWSRWVEADLASKAEGGSEARAHRWAESPVFREAFLLITGVSPALAEELERSWEWFTPERWQAGWETLPSLAQRLRSFLAVDPGAQLSEEEFNLRLRRFRRTEELRIAYLDECRRLPVDDVTLQISWLADTLIDASLARAREEVAKRLGIPPPSPGEPCRGFAVLAMGKLGSLELNYSSDIDLIFIGDPDGPGDAPIEMREIYFGRLADRLISIITTFTDEGQLYRVDTRLRPGGSSSRQVWPVRAATDYYHSEGRTWERQALIRLRPVAGDIPLARSFCRELDPFIFRKILSGEEITELRGLKGQVERLALERGESETHVKIGRGGIRDVEYIVQYLQLLHGASNPVLKEANLFRVLEALEKHNLLNADETDSLRRGYRFLRQVEHRIQLNYLRQTHRLPEDPADLRRIARGLGHEGLESFQGRLARNSAQIRRVYQRLFKSAMAPAEEEERLTAILELPLETVAVSGREYLETFGFSRPDEALRCLRRLAGEEGTAWDQGRAREVFRSVAPRLLRELSQYPDPDRTLLNFHDYVMTLGARSVFYQLLAESEPALLLVLEIAGRSTYAIEVLRAYPGLFDEVIDAILTGYGFDRQILLKRAEEIIQEAEDSSAALFDFKYLHFLLIAFRDLDRSLNLTNCMEHLSGVADAVLHVAEQLAAEKVVDPPLEFLILGLGKLGGEELNYRSDLDVVFLYRPPEGAEPSEAALYQERAHLRAQEVLNLLSVRDQLGPLFKVDVRLRPMGSKNLLAVSFDGLRSYFEEGTARVWERQAFLRARPVAGSPGLARDATAFIRERMPLGTGENPLQAKQAVAEMRRRLEEAAGKGDFIKRGRGGIVDVEFIAQTLQILHGREHPEILTGNTSQAIERLSRAGLLSPSAAAELLTSYQFLRWLETRLSLLMAPEESLPSMDRDRLRSLIHRIGYRSSGEVAAEEIFEEELEYHRKKNREHLERLLERRV